MCSKPENRAEVAKLITDRSFTGAKPKKKGAPIDKFTRPGIVGDYDYGGFDDKSVAKSLTQRFSLISLLTFPNSQENTPRLCGAQKYLVNDSSGSLGTDSENS